MNKQRYITEAVEASEQNSLESYIRTIPVSVKDVKRTTTISILEEYLLKWAPRDVRYEESYLDSHKFNFTDSEFMIDIAEGMVLKVIDKLPTEDAIVIGIYLQSNIAEFERYNQTVVKHNDTWIQQGSPEDVFNPLTGDINEIKDTLVKGAVADSPYRKVPTFDFSTGPLTKARPKTKRSLYAKVKVQLKIKAGLFQVSFVAWDSKDQIIYYNVLSSADIAYLSRRVVHELFGNPFVYSSTGALLEGIPFLIQGKKLPVCHKNNKIPEWSNLEKFAVKNTNPDVIRNKSSEVLFRIVGSFFGYIVPIYVFWVFIIVKSYSALKKTSEDIAKGDPTWLPVVLVALVAIVASFMVAKYCFRQANVLKLTSKLL